MDDERVAHYDELQKAKEERPETGLELLNREIKGVSEALDVLTERLDPVLREEYPGTEVTDTDHDSENLLRRAARQVAWLGQRISYLDSRIDL